MLCFGTRCTVYALSKRKCYGSVRKVCNPKGNSNYQLEETQTAIGTYMHNLPGYLTRLRLELGEWVDDKSMFWLSVEIYARG